MLEMNEIQYGKETFMGNWRHHIVDRKVENIYINLGRLQSPRVPNNCN